MIAKIQLGFIAKKEENDLENQKYNLPMNKAGGKPDWLDPRNPLEASQVTCNVCGGIMALLLQLYCPEDYPENAFHRVLYVFLCKNGLCLKGRSQSGLKIFRSQLSLNNDFYDMEGMSKLSQTSLKKMQNDYCDVCGLKAPSRCGQCQQRRYCSKQHQALDWTQGKHKDYCQKSIESGKLIQSPDDIFLKWIDACALFPMHFLEEDEEPEKKSIPIENLSNEVHTALHTKEEGDEELEEEQETETDVDKLFLKFQKRISLAPDQVLRYGRVLPTGNEDPLWVNSESIPKEWEIPPCHNCGEERTFEFQVNPQLLMHLDLDNKDPNAIDWGTIIFYTCSQHCNGANGGYNTEFFIKQDFSSAGVGDSARKELENQKQMQEKEI